MARPKRPWSDADDKLVKSKEPVSRICALLKISPPTLTARRHELGVIHDPSRHDERIRAEYGKTQRKILADRLGVSERWLDKRARYLGLNRLTIDWTPEKAAWLLSNIEKLGKKKAAKILKCSKRAVAIKLWRLGVEDDMLRSDLSMTFVADDLLNISHDTLERWVRMKLLQTVKGDGKRRFIRPSHLRKFIIKHADRIDPKRIGDGWDMFVQLVAGQWG